MVGLGRRWKNDWIFNSCVIYFSVNYNWSYEVIKTIRVDRMICKKCGGEVHIKGTTFIPMGKQCHCESPELIR